MFRAKPKSASLTWVRDSSRSTLSAAKTKQTDVEWEYSCMSASLRATRTRITPIRKFQCKWTTAELYALLERFSFLYISQSFSFFPRREKICFAPLWTTHVLKDNFFLVLSLLMSKPLKAIYFQGGLNVTCQLLNQLKIVSNFWKLLSLGLSDQAWLSLPKKSGNDISDC